jgi:DNA-binding response OmpR family regulator
MRILLIEDEQTLAGFIEQGLRAEGYAATVELPVIVLTARAAIEQRVEGLDRGANDYVTKPFAFEELLARVRAQLRVPGQRESAALEVADIRMDLRTRRVTSDGHEVTLTAREFELLAYLMRHPDQVLSREQILNAVWGFDFDPGTKVLEVYIGYLRRRLADAGESDAIETVRGVGYRLRAA